MQGSEVDTLETGKLPQDGRLSIRIPENYKGYKGMVSWMLESGGGLAMVINGEDFSVECLESLPDKTNIRFYESEENFFLRENYYTQQKIFEKHDAILKALDAYTEKDSLYPLFQSEMNNINFEYAVFRQELKNKNLYAARFREISDAVIGIGEVVYKAPEEQSESLIDFITNQMNWEDLYTSGHWKDLISMWVEMHLKTFETDNELLQNTRTVLNKISREDIYTDFTETLLSNFIKTGKDQLIVILREEIKSSGKLIQKKEILSMLYAINVGDKAPELILNEETVLPNHNEYDLFESKTLLVFHQSGCSKCQIEMDTLVDLYANLKQKGVRIISISADTDATKFKYESMTFPWKESYCDLNGIGGINFKNYTVTGTPTFILVDEGNVVKARTAQLKDLDILK